VRKPDAAFVSFDRWPADRPISYRGNPLPVVPDLMVEVASPTDEAEELLKKAYEYLRAGARLVWIVFPANRALFAYTGPTAVRAFSDADTLDAGDVLPGFQLPMGTLFPPVTDLPEGKDDE
jgi:Uma2 family endonuclease